MRSIRRWILLLAAICVGQAASAQEPTARAFTSYHPFEIAGTYSHMVTDASFGSSVGLNGFTVSGAANVISVAQATAEIGRCSGKGIAVTSFLAGPQAGFHIYRFQPFVRGLFGLSHTSIASRSAGNSFTITAGGGVNYLVTDQIAIRALQVDYYRPIGGPYKAADFLRIGFGVAYEFGTR